MKTETLLFLRDQLTSLGMRDITQSLLTRNSALEMGTGLLKALSFIPEEKAEELVEFSAGLTNAYTVENFYTLLQSQNLLTFEPYVYEHNKYGKVIVCAINRFVVFDDGYFKVVTDLDKDSTLARSSNSINCIIEQLRDSISTDTYNAILATFICTTFMCKNLRDGIRNSSPVVTVFLEYVLRNCKAPQVYSVETLKSKLSWVNLAQKSNYNYALSRLGKLSYNISIGSDATTIQYMSTIGGIGYVTLLYDQSKLTEYDSLFDVKSCYFAYALYLLVADVFQSEFEVVPRTGIKYAAIDDLSDLYWR